MHFPMAAVNLHALAGEWRTVVIGQLSISEMRRAVTEPIMILLNARMCVVIASPLFVLPSFIFLLFRMVISVAGVFELWKMSRFGHYL